MHCGDSAEVGSMWKNNFLSIAPWLLSLTTDSTISFVSCKLILIERSFIYYLVIILRHYDKNKQENNAVS